MDSEINESKWLYPLLNDPFSIVIPGLGKNMYKWRWISSEVIWKIMDYPIWLYFLFIDLAVNLFMHLLNTYLLSASTPY